MHNRLKQARVEVGLTQKEVAEKLGKDPSTVSLWESDARKPDAETIFDLADLYGVSAYWLVRGKSRNFFPDTSSLVEYRGHHLVIVPVVENLRLDHETGELLYKFVGVTGAETTISFYSHFENNTEPGKMVWTSIQEDGMSGYHILPGSFVLVSLMDDVEDGSIALLIQDGRILCRKIYHTLDGKIRLITANPNVVDETYDKAQIRFVGKVIGASTRFQQ